MKPFQEDQVVSMTLWVRLDTLQRYAPQGLNVEPTGAIGIDGPTIISTLFAVPNALLNRWMQKATRGLSFLMQRQGEAETRNAGEAAGQIASSLLHGGFTEEQIKGFDFYVFARDDIRLYFVVVGHLVNPPSNAIVGRIG